MNFFINNEEFQRGFQRALARYFTCPNVNSAILLAKSVETMYDQIALKRLYDHNAAVQLIISLRNPIERAYSAYWYARRMGWEAEPTFERALVADPNRFENDWVKRRGCAYLDRGNYYKYLIDVYKLFRKEQIHIFLLEDLLHDMKHICRQIFSLFDEFDPLSAPQATQRRNKAAAAKSAILARLLSRPYRVKRTVRRLIPDRVTDGLKIGLLRLNEKAFIPPPMKPESRSLLVEHFSKQNEQLGDLLDRDLSHWNH